MKNKDYDRNEVQKLKDRIEALRGENRRLKKAIKAMTSELQTMKSAWKKTEDFLHEMTAGVPLEKLLKIKTLPKKALRKKMTKKEPIDQREIVRDKWANLVKGNRDEEMD